MKIEDMQAVPEFFGVKAGSTIWIDNIMFAVWDAHISGVGTTLKRDGQALVGCLTGQLKWSTTEPMTADEEKILREIAAWYPQFEKLRLNRHGDIEAISRFTVSWPFGSLASAIQSRTSISKAYEALLPILDKCGEINLDDYREKQSKYCKWTFEYSTHQYETACGWKIDKGAIVYTTCPKCHKEIEI